MGSVYQAKPWLKHYSEGVRASLNYPEKTLHELFWQTTEKYPGLTATVFLGQEMQCM